MNIEDLISPLTTRSLNPEIVLATFNFLSSLPPVVVEQLSSKNITWLDLKIEEIVKIDWLINKDVIISVMIDIDNIEYVVINNVNSEVTFRILNDSQEFLELINS